jgi:hypothetical protein
LRTELFALVQQLDAQATDDERIVGEYSPESPLGNRRDGAAKARRYAIARLRRILGIDSGREVSLATETGGTER